MRSASKQLRGSQLREVYLSGVEVRGSSGTPGLEHLLLQALTSSLHHLTLLSLAGMNLTPPQALTLAKVGEMSAVNFLFTLYLLCHSFQHECVE